MKQDKLTNKKIWLCFTCRKHSVLHFDLWSSQISKLKQKSKNPKWHLFQLCHCCCFKPSGFCVVHCGDPVSESVTDTLTPKTSPCVASVGKDYFKVTLRLRGDFKVLRQRHGAVGRRQRKHTLTQGGQHSREWQVLPFQLSAHSQ